MIELGQKVKDPITGFEGIAVAKTQWLYGCTRFGVQARIDKDGKVPEAQWFDEPQLEAMPPVDAQNRGGPRADPRRNRDPARQIVNQK